MFSYYCICFFFFFKQKTAYEMRISDWSSDVCSSDLVHMLDAGILAAQALESLLQEEHAGQVARGRRAGQLDHRLALGRQQRLGAAAAATPGFDQRVRRRVVRLRSEEHTSELQSLMRNSYAVFC